LLIWTALGFARAFTALVAGRSTAAPASNVGIPEKTRKKLREYVYDPTVHNISYTQQLVSFIIMAALDQTIALRVGGMFFVVNI
jgi:hypothetical protein